MACSSFNELVFFIPNLLLKSTMSQLERLQRINHILQERGIVPAQDFLHELEISLPTFKRDLTQLRNSFNAPIIYDRYSGGYKFDKPNVGKKFELPGIWFSESETTALVMMHHLLSNLDQGGLLGPHLSPLMSRIDSILSTGSVSSNELRKRIKVIPIGARSTSLKNFSEIGLALLKRERIGITYYAKTNDITTDRIISPQRLVYYKSSWYLDAYCHLRNELRSFAVDGIKKSQQTNIKAIDIPEKELDENFTESYGIFSGKANKKVKLKFSPRTARWVSTEEWHPNQIGSFDKQGFYSLEFEYNQDPELIMDILKYGSSVEVMSPTSLRTKVAKELKKAIEKY
jgi:predicted DNA-binding transcriptional regulator YafY